MLAATATDHMDDATIAAMRRADTRLDSAIARGDIPAYLRENHGFHTLLNARAGRPIQKSLVDSLWLRFGPSQRVICGQMGTRNLPDRHKELLDALTRRDRGAAFAAIEEDVVQGMSLITRAIAPETRLD